MTITQIQHDIDQEVDKEFQDVVHDIDDSQNTFTKNYYGKKEYKSSSLSFAKGKLENISLLSCQVWSFLQNRKLAGQLLRHQLENRLSIWDCNMIWDSPFKESQELVKSDLSLGQKYLKSIKLATQSLQEFKMATFHLCFSRKRRNIFGVLFNKS